MNNVTYGGEINVSELKFIDIHSDDIPKYTVEDGDIVFNRTNSAELVGKTAVVLGLGPMAFAGYLVRLRVNERAVPEYISTFLNSPFGKRTLRGMAKSIIGMANINAKEVQSILIPQPPVALQRTFAGRIAEVGRLKAVQLGHLNKLDALFAALQHRAFRGELTSEHAAAELAMAG
jgi:type I restriction enzyme S subunit